MEIKEYKNIEEALDNLLTDDLEYILVSHTLKEGEKIEEHFHPDVDEYVILNNGRIKISLEEEVQEINAIEKAITVKFPGGAYHSLTPLTNVKYFVLRTGNDETIYL